MVTMRGNLHMLRRVALGLALALSALSGAAHAAPVAVRVPEGTTRGFLVLRDRDGTAIAHGELTQKPSGAMLVSRLVLNFADGSLFDETLTFSQQKVFRLERYHFVQRGPSFPASDITFDRATGRYQARTQDKPGGEEKQAAGRFEFPPDLYNGMALTLLKNLPTGGGTSVQMVAFTPEPRLIRMELTREGEDRVRVGPKVKVATRYLVNLEIGGVTGVVAAMIGKDPPDLRYWVIAGEVPAFARFEGAMYLNGPVWRLEQAQLEWVK